MKLFDPWKYDVCYGCGYEAKDGRCKIRNKVESCVYLKGYERNQE